MFEHNRNKRSIHLAQKILKRSVPKRVLNIGAGEGFLERAFSILSPKVHTVAVEPKLKKGVVIHAHKVIEKEFEEIVFWEETFDAIVFSLSLHHMKEPKKALAAARELLGQKGGVYILDIAPETLLGKVFLFDTRILCFNRRHTWTRSQLERLITEAGFDIQKSEPFSSGTILIYAKKS